MSVAPTADEIFEMAEQIERNGARFYRRAAQGFTDSRAGRRLLDLAAMERGFARGFAPVYFQRKCDLGILFRDGRGAFCHPYSSHRLVL